MGMEVEHVRLFAVFLAAGLVEMNSESLHFSNASSIEKQIQLYPQAVSRLGQHLLRANSKVENFGLFALYSSFFLFFICLFGCPMTKFWLLSSKQSLSPNVNHCNWAIRFWPRAGLGRAGSLHLTECPVSFDRNAITPHIVENTLPRLKPSFSEIWKCSQYSKLVLLDILVTFRLENTSLDAKFRVQNFSFLLVN